MTSMRCWTCGGEMVKTVKDAVACGDEAYEPDTARRMLELSREGGDAQ